MHTRKATHALTVIAAATALTATLTGCNPSADANPTPTIGTCTDCTTASTPTGSTTPTSSDAAAQEKADRAAAEALWRKYVSVLYTLDTMPADQVVGAVKAVSVDPTLSLMLKKSADDRASGRAAYGVPFSYVLWPQPINGAATAVLTRLPGRFPGGRHRHEDWQQAHGRNCEHAYSRDPQPHS